MVQPKRHLTHRQQTESLLFLNAFNLVLNIFHTTIFVIQNMLVIWSKQSEIDLRKKIETILKVTFKMCHS